MGSPACPAHLAIGIPCSRQCYPHRRAMKFIAHSALPRWLHFTIGLILLLFAGLSGSHLRIPEPLPLPAFSEYNPAPAKSRISQSEKVSHSGQPQAGPQPDTAVFTAPEQPLNFVFPNPD